MKLWKFFLIALMAGSLAVSSCSEDETTEPGSSNDPNVLCDRDLCAENDALKNECIERYNTCINVDEGSHDECIALALGVCGI